MTRSRRGSTRSGRASTRRSTRSARSKARSSSRGVRGQTRASQRHKTHRVSQVVVCDTSLRRFSVNGVFFRLVNTLFLCSLSFKVLGSKFNFIVQPKCFTFRQLDCVYCDDLYRERPERWTQVCSGPVAWLGARLVTGYRQPREMSASDGDIGLTLDTMLSQIRGSKYAGPRFPMFINFLAVCHFIV